MPAIGHVTRTSIGGFKGQLRTLSIKASVEIVPNESKSSDNQPDYRVLSEGTEIGAGWICRFINRDKRKVVVVVFDNVDKLDSEDQIRVFQTAQWFRARTQSFCLLPLRDETCERFSSKAHQFVSPNPINIVGPNVGLGGNVA